MEKINQDELDDVVVYLMKKYNIEIVKDSKSSKTIIKQDNKMYEFTEDKELVEIENKKTENNKEQNL